MSRIQKDVFILLITGFIIRLLFFWYGARVYYGTDDFTLNGDSWSWIDSFLNLLNHGIYTADLAVENALYYRPPGFAYFFGIFYLLCGKDIDTTLKLIPYVQIVLDTICILFIYRISMRMFESRFIAVLNSAIYTLYPFVIVWTPVITAESSSIFFMLASLHFYMKGGKRSYILSGLFLGASVLIRLQTIFVFPFMALALLWKGPHRKPIGQALIPFAFAFSVVYGMWPLRNMLLHNRIMFSQDLRIGKNWSPDYLAFMDYIFSIKTDHKPQYDQIINHETVYWPEGAFRNEKDSVLLAETIEMCRKCGTGFSYFMVNAGKRKSIVEKNENCDEVIANNFHHLQSVQKEQNAFNYYVTVPLSNLYKCFFKLKLYGEKSRMVMMFTLILFLYRTLLIFAGIAGLILIYKKMKSMRYIVIMMTGFFIVWYLYLSFVYRNIEIRYLLPVDILLLLPAGYTIAYVLKKTPGRNSIS